MGVGGDRRCWGAYVLGNLLAGILHIFTAKFTVFSMVQRINDEFRDGVFS